MKPRDSIERRLEGQRIAVTGKLASMSRDEVIERIGEAGGLYVISPRGDTDMLVVGEGGPPLGDDGQLTASLRQARTLQAEGAPIRILREEEWLALLDLRELADGLHRLYTTEQLARILGVRPTEVRAWMRHGLVRPVRTVRRLAFFDFRQVANARALVELARQGISTQRIRRSLDELGDWCESDVDLVAQLETLAGGDALVVRLEDGRLAEPSGQLFLSFDAKKDMTNALEPELLAIRRPWRGPVAPLDWFHRGMIAEEEGQLDAAIHAYERSLEEYDGAEVRFNLGNVLFQLERYAEAAKSFRVAVEKEPDYVEAWNNLGNVQGELGLASEAQGSYQRALAVAPDYADAHFNLAETLQTSGDLEGAKHHWREYLARDPQSRWADEVRARLDELEPTS